MVRKKTKTAAVLVAAIILVSLSGTAVAMAADTQTYNLLEDFSTTQQGPVWYYQYRDANGNYVDCDQYRADWKMWYKSGSDCGVNAEAMICPGGDIEGVATWKAPESGKITVSSSTGTISVTQTQGDGVAIKIFLNDKQVWPADGYQNLKPGETFNFQELNLDCKKGDLLHFVVNPNGQPWYDNVTWPVKITLTPEIPAPVAQPNPKTGDNGIAVFVFLIAASLIGMFLLKKNSFITKNN